MCLQNTFDTVYILLVVQFSLGAKYDAVGPQIFCKIPVVYKFGAKFEARVPKWSAICLFQYNLPSTVPAISYSCGLGMWKL